MGATRRRSGILLLILLGSGLLLVGLLQLTARAAAAPGPATAAAPAGGHPLLRGHLGGAAADVAAGPEVLYAAVGPALLVVDAATATRLGGSVTNDLLRAVAVSGTDVVAVGSRLHLFDAADPAQPGLTGSSGPTGAYRDVAASDGYAFGVRSDDNYPFGRLETFRIDGANPIHVGGVDLPAAAYGVAVSGTLAGVAASTGGLLLLDVANPAAPALLATVSTGGYALDVALADGRAYVLSAGCIIGCPGQLLLFDLADLAAPTLLGSVDLPLRPRRVVVAGDRAYVANSAGGLLVVDAADPAQPAVVGSAVPYGEAQGVVATGDQLFVAAGGGGVAAMARGSSPQISATLSTATSPVDAAAVGDTLLLAAGDGLRLADRAALGLVGHWPTAVPAAGVTVSGSVALLAANEAGLLLVDVNQPASPQLLGSLDTPGLAHAVAVSGGVAYVADGPAGLQLVDVTDAAEPGLLATLNTPGDARDVVVSGTWAYVADGSRGLRIVDVANPAAPQTVGVYDTPGTAVGVGVAGSLAFVADSLAGLRIVDVGDPARPQEVGALVTRRLVTGLAPVGGFVYITNDDFGLAVIDVTDPAAPLLVGDFDTAGRARAVDLTAAGELLLVDWLGGLYVLADPAASGGAVRQANGAPFPGVTVAVAGHDPVLVDGTGGYQFGDLAPGRYGVTPTLAGYVFWPPARSVTVPPDAMGVDFTILTPPTGTVVIPGQPATLTVSDTQDLPTTFVFPAGSVGSETSVVVTPTMAVGAATLVFAAHAWELGVRVDGVWQPDFSFGMPVSVTVAYGELDVSGVGDERTLGLYRWSGTAWEPAGGGCGAPQPALVDVDANLLTTSFCHSGLFALLGAPPQLFMPLAPVGGS